MGNKNISQLESLKNKSKREADLFFSLCENGQDFVKSIKLKEAISQSGLKPNDNRLQSLFKRLEAHGDKIVFEDFISSQTALNRLPTINEVAQMVLFLASDSASAITGQCINVDCGVFPQ